MVIRVLILFCLLFSQRNSLIAQNAIYLERKGIENEVGSNLVSISHTLSSDKKILATYLGKYSFGSGKTNSVSITGRLFNVSTGRLEKSKKGFVFFYQNNKLYISDLTRSAGILHEPHTLFSSISSSAINYEVSSESNDTIRLPKNPIGYGYAGTLGRFHWLQSLDGKQSALAEVKSRSFSIKSEWEGRKLRITPDKTKFYSINGLEIRFYDVNERRYLYSIYGSIGLQYATVLKDGRIFCLYHGTKSQLLSIYTYSATMLSSDGIKILKSYNSLGSNTDISENEKEIITIDDDATIRIISVESGQLIAKMKDTFIPSKNLNPDFTKKVNKSISVSPPFQFNGGDFYLVAYSSGIMSLVSSKARKVIASYFVDENDWAIIGKDGRFDGTPGAFDKLEWREYDGETLINQTSLETAYNKYYTPRLFSSILNDSMAPTIEAPVFKKEGMPTVVIQKLDGKLLDYKKDVIPVYRSLNKNISLDIFIGENRNQLSELRLYQNGKLVEIQKSKGTDHYFFGLSLNSAYGERNSIYVVASSKSGIDTEKSKIFVDYSGVDESKPKIYSVFVGINNYLNPRYKLKYALPDAIAIMKQFKENKSALFETTEAVALFDSQATKVKIDSVFKLLSKSVKEQDLFIFYFAGHGTKSETVGDEEFYFVPQDVTQLYGNQEMLNKKALSTTEIKKLTVAIKAQKQIFIIDACHSAGALGKAANRGALEERAISQLARSTGTYWLTAAGSEQFATEFDQLGHGAFTYSLLEALSGRNEGMMSDGTLTVRELSSYVENRVPELSLKFKSAPQYPASFSFGNDFPILVR